MTTEPWKVTISGDTEAFTRWLGKHNDAIAAQNKDAPLPAGVVTFEGSMLVKPERKWWQRRPRPISKYGKPQRFG